MNLHWRVGGQSDLSCDACDTLDFGDTVDHCVPCGVWVGFDVLFLAGAEIGAADEFADDYEVCALGDFGAERRVGEEGVGGEVCGADVGV